LSYCIDTSALLDGWVRYYPPDVFPSIWTQVDTLVGNGLVIASEEVLVELEKKDDDVYKWAKARPSIFFPHDTDIQREVDAILASHPGLVDPEKRRSIADPFVVALAKIKGSTVVTGERLSRNPSRPRIPDVCNALRIPCLDLLGMFRELGWKV
jgi:hypothetical protein